MTAIIGTSFPHSQRWQQFWVSSSVCPATVLLVLVLHLFSLIPLPIYITCKYSNSNFRLNTLWVTAFYYANPLYLMGISLLIHAHFFQECNQVIKQELGVYGLNINFLDVLYPMFEIEKSLIFLWLSVQEGYVYLSCSVECAAFQ